MWDVEKGLDKSPTPSFQLEFRSDLEWVIVRARSGELLVGCV